MNISILFVCIHNSARSQIAEAFINNYYSDKFKAESAGIVPGNLNPLVVKSLNEIGIDISGNKTKSVNDILNTGKSFDYVITVCEKEAAEKCPVFPGNGIKLQWWFLDPSKFTGTESQKLEEISIVRDEIKSAVDKFVEEINL
ncbi:MAG TPA: arsenate reductase ArsC [Ignavibacteria bacterium]|nr:arsenate reductase ArsC [Ignavibacteria bacterium]